MHNRILKSVPAWPLVVCLAFILLVAAGTLLASLVLAPAPLQAGTVWGQPAEWGAEVVPNNETYVLPAIRDTAVLEQVIEATAKPRSVIYVLDTDPAELSRAVPGSIAKIVEYEPTAYVTRILSYVLAMPDGSRKICSMSISGEDMTDAQLIDEVTKYLNSLGEKVWDEEAIKEDFDDTTVVEEPGERGVGTDANPYWYYVGSIGMQSTQYYWRGWLMGQTDFWFSTKVVRDDNNSTYDYWAIHMYDDVRPGHYLVGNNWGLWREHVAYQCISGQQTIYYSSPPNNNAPNDTVSVSLAGACGLPGLAWTYHFHGSTANRPYEVEREGNNSWYAKWRHNATQNDWSNYDTIITLAPGWNQRTPDAVPLKLGIWQGSSYYEEEGSHVWFNFFFDDTGDWRICSPVPGIWVQVSRGF